MNNSFKKTLVASAITLSLAGCNNDSDSTSQDQPAASPLQVSLEKHNVTRHGKIKGLKATVSLTNSAGIAGQLVVFKTGNGESILPHSCTLSSEKPSCKVSILPHQVAKTTRFEATTIKTTFKDGQARTMAQENAGDAPKATAQLDGDTSVVANPTYHSGGIYLAPPILNSTGQTIQAFYIHNWANSSGNWIYGGPVGYTNGKNMNWQNGVEIAHSWGEWYDPNTLNPQDLTSLNWNANGYLGGTYETDVQIAYAGETTKWTLGLLINGTCYNRHDEREADKSANDNFQGWGPTMDEVETEEGKFKWEYGEFQGGFWGEFTSNEDGTFNFVIYSGLARVIDYAPIPFEGDSLSSTWHLTPGDMSTCTAGSVPTPPAAALGPVGSYKQTCQNVSWQSNAGKDPWDGTLTAYCADGQGHSFFNSVQYAQACHDGSTMSNIQGHLRCDEAAHDLPPNTSNASNYGNYLKDCAINSTMDATNLSSIDAYCPSYPQNGAVMIASTVYYNESLSSWADHNSVGYDSFGYMFLGKSISGFQDRSPYIPGSYRETCSNINWSPGTSEDNPYDGNLSATCSDGNGNSVQNSINPADICYIGSFLSNFHGYLQCDIPAYGLPISNWQQLCGNVTVTESDQHQYNMTCQNPATGLMGAPQSIVVEALNNDLWNYYISVQSDGSLVTGPAPLPPSSQ